MSASKNGPQAGPQTVDRVDETDLASLQQDSTIESSHGTEASARHTRQAAHVGTWEWHSATQRVLWSPEVETIYGIAPGTFGGAYEDVFRFVHPDDRQRLSEAILHAFTERTPYEIEHRLIRPDGTERWVLCRGTAVTDLAGSVTGMAGTVTDTTDQKRTAIVETTLRLELERRVAGRTAELEQAVKDLTHEIERRQQAEIDWSTSEERFRALYDDNPTMYFTLSPDGTVLSVNRFGAEQLGYSTEELTGQSILLVFRPEDHQTVLGQLIVCAASPSRLFQWNIQKIRRDGTLLFVHERARAVLDRNGQMLVLVVCEDITAQRAADEERHRTTQALQALIQMSPLAVMALDPTGETVTLWNRAAESMFGWTVEETLGKPAPFLLPDKREESDRLFAEFLRQGHLSGVELRRTRRDGSPIDLALWATVLKDTQGTIVSTLGFLADITRRKQVEAALRESEQAIRSLQEATSAPSLSFEQRLHTVLELGCRRFKLPIGVVTRVDGDHLEVFQIWPPTGDLKAGQRVPLCQTYCSATLQTAEPLCFEHGSASEWRTHPGYTLLGLECYIGARLAGQETLYGTLCFMGKDPYPTLFSDADKDFLLLMARWVSGEFDRQIAERLLKDQDALLRAVTNTATDAIFMKDTEGRYRLINAAGAAVIGRPVEEIIGKTDKDLFAAQTAAQLMADDRRVLQGTTQHHFETVIPFHGEMRMFSSIKTPHRDPHGNVIGVVGVSRDMTDLRHAEDEHRKTERLFASFMEHLPGLAWMKDVSGRYVYLNGAFERTFHVTSAEWQGKTDREVWPSEIADQFMASDQRVLATKGSILVIETTLQSDGPHASLVSKFPVTDDTGTMLFIGGVAIDITEQKEAEAALRDSEARWRTLFEHAGVGIAQIGLDGQFLRVNARLCQTLGYASKTLMQLSVQALTHPDDLDRNLLLLNEILAGTRPSFTMEKRYLRSDGVWLWANLTVSLVRAASGAPTYFIAVVEDISERKQAEEALRMSEIQWQRFVADAPVGMVIVDRQRRLLNANKAFCALTGHDEADVIGNTIALFTHPDDLPYNLVLLDDFFAGKRAGYTYEKRYIRKSGEIIWVSVRTTKMSLPGHAGPLLLAVVENITDRKHATEERDQLSQDLHDDVLQSLYAIGMGLEITQQRVKHRSRTAAKRLEGSVTQLNNVIRDVRNFIPRMHLPTAPPATFEQAMLALVDALTANGVGKIALDVDAALAATLTSTQCTHLLSIAREALSNSLRHARARHRSLTLRQSRGKIRLTISDDGIGFRSAPPPPEGMGLRNMQARARKMGATLAIVSRRGQGTQVRIALPALPKPLRSKKAGGRRRPQRPRRRAA